MKWLHVLPTSEVGGCERLAAGVARELWQDEHVFLVPNSSGQFALYLQSSGYQTCIAPSLGPRNYASKKNRHRLERIIADLLPDVIVAWMGQPGTAILERIKIPTQTAVLGHGASVYSNTSRTKFKSVLYRLADLIVPQKRSALLVACSEAVAESYKSCPYLRHKKCTTILNGVSVPEVRNWVVPPPPVTVGMVARLDSAKDHITLIRAMKFLPKGIRLELAGDGPTRPKLESFARQEGLLERVFFLGQVQEPQDLLRRWHLFVFSGTSIEGYSLAVAEAMAFGIPVVAASAGGVPEVVSNAGVLVRAADPKRLAKEIERVLKDPALSDKLSHFGYSRAVGHLSIALCARYWRDLALRSRAN